jgi:hypothetical protein
MSAEHSDNVVALAPYQARRAIQQRQPRPYLLWYPHIGFVKPTATLARFAREDTTRRPERA